MFRANGPDQPARNYVVLHFPAGDAFGTRLGGGQESLGWGFRAVCVGLRTDDNCLFVVQLMRSLFRNWSPAPSEDFTSWLSEESDGAPLIKDDEIPSDLRYSLTLRYTLTTRS